MKEFVSVVVIFSIIVFFIYIFSSIIQNTINKGRYGPLETVCQGVGVEESAAFIRDEKLHPAIAVVETPNGLSFNKSAIPEEVVASSVADTQLVLCLSEVEEVLLERCSYANENGGTNFIERYRYQQKVELVEAKSGKLVAEKLLKGSVPGRCRDSAVFIRGTETLHIWGSKITDNVLQEWVSPYLIK